MNQSILKKVLIAGTTLLLAAGGARAAHEPLVRVPLPMVKTPAGLKAYSLLGSGENSP